MLRMCNPTAYTAMACSCFSQYNLESKGVVFTRNNKKEETSRYMEATERGGGGGGEGI